LNGIFSPHLLSQQGLPLTPVTRKEKRSSANLGLLFMFMFAKGKRRRIRVAFGWSRSNLVAFGSDDPDQIRLAFGWSRSNLVAFGSDDPDRIRLAFGWSRSNICHLWMIQIKSGWLLMPQIKSSDCLWMAEIKSGHPRTASFGCCALLMDEQNFFMGFYSYRDFI
jgi:hypothetical protein